MNEDEKPRYDEKFAISEGQGIDTWFPRYLNFLGKKVMKRERSEEWQITDEGIELVLDLLEKPKVKAKIQEIVKGDEE